MKGRCIKGQTTWGQVRPLRVRRRWPARQPPPLKPTSCKGCRCLLCCGGGGQHGGRDLAAAGKTNPRGVQDRGAKGRRGGSQGRAHMRPWPPRPKPRQATSPQPTGSHGGSGGKGQGCSKDAPRRAGACKRVQEILCCCSSQRCCCGQAGRPPPGASRRGTCHAMLCQGAANGVRARPRAKPLTATRPCPARRARAMHKACQIGGNCQSCRRFSR